jgi:c-di-GMP-binding flagellar brake protein YcgR
MIVELEQKRKHPRVSCSGEASVHFFGDGMSSHARILDLSLEGCLIALEAPIEVKPDAVVELSFSVKQLPFRVRAQVKVVRSHTTLGFQFLQINRRGRSHQLELMEELSEETMQQMPGSKFRPGGSGVEVRAPRSTRLE